MSWKNMSLLEYINSEERGFFLPDMATNGLKLIDKKAYEVYQNPDEQLKLALKMNEIFESDFIYSLCDGAIFCETLGLNLLKPDYDFASVISHPIKTLEDVYKLKIPDPYTSGRMPTNLKSLMLISKNIDKPLYVSIQGPFTLAVQLAGATHFLRAIIKDPKFVDALLDFTKSTVMAYAQAAVKSGAKYISISEPGTVTLSPQRFENLVIPRVNEILDDLDCWKGMHICGDTTHFLDLMLNCNLDAISLDQIMDYKKVAPKVPQNIVLIGNLDPIELVGKGNPEEIKNQAIKLCQEMKPYSNFLAALGCNCLNDTPDQNLIEAINTCRRLYREI